MQLTSIATFFLFAVYAAAVDVACLVNGIAVAVVDLDTGVCPFQIPAAYPVAFNFVSLEDYDATFYYATVGGTRFFTDIVAAGRIISIPANELFEASVPFFQVDLHLHESNSTAAIRRRLLKQVEVEKRAPIDDFLAYAQAQDGTAIAGSTFAVVLAEDISSSVGPSPTGPSGISTVTSIHTTTATITTCSDNKCGVTTVPLKPTLTTETIDGKTTVYTTYCPETTVITITSCSDHKCATTSAPYTHILTTGTIEGSETVYYTVCPLTLTTHSATKTGEVTHTTYKTVTSCSDICHTSTVPYTTVYPTTTVVTYTTYVTPHPTTAAPTTVAPTTVAPVTSVPSTVAPVHISTHAGVGAKVGLSLAAVVPFLGFLI